MIEIWKNIPNYNGRYQISNYGNIKSLNYKRTGKPGLLKLHLNNWGYLAISFLHNKKRQTYVVHKLVAQLFVKKVKGKNTINHINGNKTCNISTNLEWVTIRENVLHAYRTGLNDEACKKRSARMRKLKSEDTMRAILNEDQVIKIRNIYNNDNVTQQKLADEYGVERSTIGKIVTYKTWNKLKSENS